MFWLASKVLFVLMPLGAIIRIYFKVPRPPLGRFIWWVLLYWSGVLVLLAAFLVCFWFVNPFLATIVYLSFIIAVFGGPVLTCAILDRGRYIPPPGECQCGYNLTGNVSGICPECGTPVQNSVSKPPNPRD